MTIWAGRPSAALLPLFLFAVSAVPQSNLATITGVVRDSAQAIMAGVAVTIRETETNFLRQVQTSMSGDYTITHLPPGSYELSATMPGFRTHRRTGVLLRIGDMLRNDITMELGAVTETVVVRAEVPLLNTESGTIKGDVIAHEEIQELPLDGRDFTDLAFFVPGVVPKAQGGQGSALNINGARADNTNFYVDGFNNRNARGAAAQVRPNIDAIQEFKMEVSGFSAEYGKMAGGIMNMVLRSGTNRFRGTLFEYLRNDIFDARRFFDLRRAKLRRNQYGATFSGPIQIPRIYRGRDRTFFLVSWEGYRQVLEQTRLGHTATAAQRAGDFAGSSDFLGAPVFLRDPLATGNCSERVGTACFPANVIPAVRFSPIAMRLMDYFPLPNRADALNNHISSANDADKWDSALAKIDHRFTPRDTISLRYQKRFNITSNPFAGSELGIFGNRIRNDRSLGGVDYTHLFSPTFLIELRGGFSRNANFENTVWAGRDVAEEVGIPGSTKDPLLVGFPRFTIRDYFAIGTAANQPVQFFVTDIQGGVKFGLVQGRHSMKWGFDVSRVRFNQPFFNNNRGTFNFLGRWTNHPLADFMLGLLNNTSRQVGVTRNYMRSSSYGLFLNDDYKIAPSLTLNLGLRYEIDKPPVDRYDRMSNFIPGLNKIIIADERNIPNLQQLIADAGLSELVGLRKHHGLPRSLVYTDYTNVAPRVGFAWRPFSSARSVLRGGYGIFHSGHVLNPIRLSLMTGYPFAINQTFQRVTNNPSRLTLSNPFPADRAQLGGVVNSSGYELHAPTGYLQSYNLTVERELSGGTAIEIAFVGSKGTHLGRRYDLNQPFRSLELAGQGFPRPIPGLNAINYYSFGSNSIYNAGQISFRRRNRGGLFYRLNYSYSKSIDDASQLNDASDGGFAGAQDARNLKSERSRSDWDRGHVFTGVFAWQLPVGRGRAFLSSARGFTQASLGGWQLSGTATMYSGQPFTVQTADVDLNLGESPRPNRIGNGVREDLGRGRRGVDYPWFRVDHFESVPCIGTDCIASRYGFQPFRLGNAGRNILDGPGLVNVNLAMMKDFRFGERRTLQLRWEAFNVLNRVNFQLPSPLFNAATGGTITGVGDGRGGARLMQIALKLEF